MKRLIACLFWVAGVMPAFAQGVVSDVAERQALTDFYNAMNGANWINKWTTTQINNYPATTLYGVTIVNNDIVSMNFTFDNGVAGTLPPSIGNLTALTNFTLLSSLKNNLTGTLPSTFGNLVGLTNLDLRGQRLTGSIPSVIGNLTQLTYLNLSNTGTTYRLEGPIPTQWANLTSLQTLDISNANLAGKITPPLGNLDQLQNLSLSVCSLSMSDLPGLFSGLSGCAQLKNLTLSANSISGLPPVFTQLTALIDFNMSHQNVVVNPNDLSALADHNTGTLKYVDLTQCGLTSLPSVLSTPPNSIEALYLNNNSLNPLPDVLGSIPNLKTLYLQFNGISGTPNTLLGNAPDLEFLDLSNNAITSLDPNFQLLSNTLKSLDISNNQFIGPLPEYLSNFTMLGALICNDNSITAPIPYNPSIGKLILRNNNINGDLPAGYANNIGITEFDLRNNSFTGTPGFGSSNNRFNFKLYLDNNKLDFGDIEPNFIGINLTDLNTITYTPQALVGQPITYNIIEGSNFTIPFSMGGTKNKYKWQKYNGSSWVDITGFTTTSGFSIIGFSAVHVGTYRVIITNDWATLLTLTSNTINLVLVTPICSSSVPDLNGQFKMDKLTGAIVFERNDCNVATPLSCAVGPAMQINKVVSATATTFQEGWNTNLVYDPYASISGLQLTNANDFEKANRGKWHVRSTHAYNGPLGTYDKNFNSGTFAYQPFNWKGSSTRQWLPVSKVELYSKHGEPLQESNALNIKSVAKFGYHNSVPYLTAKNAEYNWVLFESFEKSYQTNSVFEDGLPKGSGTISPGIAHAGKSSLNLPSGGNWSLRVFDFKTIFNVRPMQLKFWIRLPDQTYFSQLATDLSVSILEDTNLPAIPVKVIARTGEWTLCEAVLSNFGSLTAFTPIIRYNRSISVHIDDVRVQPHDAEMNAYVYDPVTLRLLTVFDDQHFGLYYQYNAEGKLVRKLIETVKGFKTLEETQYNTPLVNK